MESSMKARAKVVLTTALAMLLNLEVGAAIAIAESSDEKEEEAIRKLRSGDSSGLVTSRYKNSGMSSAIFLKYVPLFEKAKSRARVVLFAIALQGKAAHSKANATAPGQSTVLVAERLASIVEEDSSERVRAVAAAGLADLFPPELLDRYAETIRRAARRWKQREIVLLYGLLPSCRSEEIANIVSGMKARNVSQRYQLDGILARYGDEEAQKRLISAATSLLEASDVALERLVNALSYARTKQIKMFLAKGLRSETMIELPGETKVPKRDCFARALVRMMRHDQRFPVRAEDSYDDAKLDKIEQWCMKHLGVGFPHGPRKKLSVTPSVQPAP